MLLWIKTIVIVNWRLNLNLELCLFVLHFILRTIVNVIEMIYRYLNITWMN